VSLRQKIYVGSGVTVFILLATVVIFFNGIIHYNDRLNRGAEVHYQNADKVNQIRSSVSMISNSLRDLLDYYENENSIQDFNIMLARQEKEIAVVIEFLKSLEQSEQTKQQFVPVEVEWRVYVDNIDTIMSAVNNNDRSLLQRALVREVDNRNRIYTDIEAYLALIDADIDAAIASNHRKMNEMRLLLTLICIVMLLVVILFVLSFTRRVFDNMQRSATVMNNMALGSVEPIERMEVQSNDEFSLIAQAYNRLAGTLERHIRYERAYQKEIEEQNWLKTTIADITTMYQEVQDIGSLARKLLTKLIPLIGASYGAIYMMDESEGEPYLYKLATYAEKDPLTARDRFRVGEGLIGQCAIERQTIYLDHITEYDVRIRSALIDVAPSQVIIVPVEYEDKVLAVAEFATTGVFSTLQRLLLHQVMGGAGITIRSVLDHMRVQLLLSDSQALTHELQSQSYEMQQQQAELMSINEKLEEQYRSAELRSLELQSMKAELEEKARLLEQSSRYKSEFLANMSHELRTPLNSLLILAKILQDNEGGRLSAKQSEYAGAIYSSGQQLLQLINDILDLSKAESGKNQARKEPVRLIELLNFAEKMFMPIAREKDVEFIIEADPRLPEYIQTDPQRLQQIINNLLANAFKFTDRGQVSIHVSAIGETLVSDSFDWLAIAVSDTGIGIAEDKLSLVFEAFQQADGTTSRKYGGTGLGLSISKNSAELLGGSIKVSSREGFGSTFTLYLPLDDTSVYRPPNLMTIQEAAVTAVVQDSKKHASISSESDFPILQGRTILVVDNDIRSVFAITAILEAWHVNVVFAENGREAVEKVEADSKIEMVLMDIMMPGMDGLEAIRLIRRNSMFQELPILALTAKAMETDKEMCLEAGASDYISKPVQQEQLIALILEWLSVTTKQGGEDGDH
jgi:two-component system chemotaxis sensor kinase CheA